MCRGRTRPPTPAIAAANTTDATDKNIRSQMNRYLKDDPRAGMELLQDTHPDAYDALHEARQVDDAGYREKKAKRQAGKYSASQVAEGGESHAGG